MKISQIYTSPVITVSDKATITEAAKLMRKHNIGSLPVVNNSGKLVGMITDRDITIRNTARELDPGKHQVRDIMTTNVLCVNIDDDVDHATSIMSYKQVRRLPVVNGEGVIGFVALGDIASNDTFKFEAAKALSDISFPCHQKHPCNNGKTEDDGHCNRADENTYSDCIDCKK